MKETVARLAYLAGQMTPALQAGGMTTSTSIILRLIPKLEPEQPNAARELWCILDADLAIHGTYLQSQGVDCSAARLELGRMYDELFPKLPKEVA